MSINFPIISSNIFFFYKAFGHIDWMFLICTRNEIGSQWTIVDDDLNVHQVTYNMNIHNPIITQGWEDLRSFYSSKLDKIFFIYYVGDCCFKIHFSRRSVDSQIQSNFLKNIGLRHPLTMSSLIHFKVKLTTYYCQASHLVS